MDLLTEDLIHGQNTLIVVAALNHFKKAERTQVYRTQVSPHKHGFLVERQYDSNNRGAWITIERYFTTLLTEPRKEAKAWMMKLYCFLNQPSADLPPIEIPIAPPIAYSIHERLERAEAEIYALREKEHQIQQRNLLEVANCTTELRRQETVFEHCERIVAEVSDRQA
jgi:hypothetical protein